MFWASRQSLSSLRRLLGCLALSLAPMFSATMAGADGLRLLMVERPGCYYCIVFKRDIAPIYEIAPEGALAPLVHADLRYPLPEGVTLASRAHVTPTFILLDANGQEFDRLIGYREDFFWPYISQMIENALAAGADNP